ncbi:534_t:CDS:2, partial [Funneliformis caledonium]
DEIFHIPQAQQYCKGEYYEWNPKLTTPPGLYITSNLIIKPLSFIFFNYINLCSTNFLRATNILFGIGLYKILRKLMINFHPFQDRNLISFNALTLSLFPVGWFFNFLYYTDSGSTFFVLWSYLLSIEKKYWMSALVGGISVLFRQSNIIWNCFILGTSLLAVLSDSNYDPKIKGMSYYRGINIRSGDKSNHTAVLHIPQIFYFISFTTIFSAPIILKFDYVDRLITGLFTLKFNSNDNDIHHKSTHV